MSFCIRVLSTPVGKLLAAVSDEGVSQLRFLDGNDDAAICKLRMVAPAAGFGDEDHPMIIQLERELSEYFSGVRTDFSIPLHPSGTEFQRRVWEGLGQIPFGVVSSYGEQAGLFGNRKAIRAIAAANGRNPIVILIPCHRVIGANGALTGYAGGLPAKRWLLDHERRNADRSTALRNLVFPD